MISDSKIEWDEYFEATKWSDFNTFVPSLFLLLHGLELLLKGMVIFIGKEIEANHKTKNLISVLESDSRINKEFLETVSKYVGENPSSKIMKDF